MPRCLYFTSTTLQVYTLRPLVQPIYQRRRKHLGNEYSVEFQDVDPALASSLRRVQQYANVQEEIKVDLTLYVCLAL